jgi:hypothetical protein
MSFPFLLLACFSCIVLAIDVQSNTNTNSTPMMIWIIYGFAMSFFIWALVRALKVVR